MVLTQLWLNPFRGCRGRRCSLSQCAILFLSEKMGITIFQKTQSSLSWRRTDKGRRGTQSELRNERQLIKCKTEREQERKKNTKAKGKTRMEISGGKGSGTQERHPVCFTVGSECQGVSTGSGPPPALPPLCSNPTGKDVRVRCCCTS